MQSCCTKTWFLITGRTGFFSSNLNLAAGVMKPECILKTDTDWNQAGNQGL